MSAMLDQSDSEKLNWIWTVVVRKLREHEGTWWTKYGLDNQKSGHQQISWIFMGIDIINQELMGYSSNCHLYSCGNVDDVQCINSWQGRYVLPEGTRKRKMCWQKNSEKSQCLNWIWRLTLHRYKWAMFNSEVLHETRGKERVANPHDFSPETRNGHVFCWVDLHQPWCSYPLVMNGFILENLYGKGRHFQNLLGLPLKDVNRFDKQRRRNHRQCHQSNIIK